MKKLRIFIASPGDLMPERQKFREIVSEANKCVGKAKIELQPTGWEEKFLGEGRPQSQINEFVRRCDLFVLLLWKRWGTATGKYGSGTEEEFELARRLSRRRRYLLARRPDIWMYFKSVTNSHLASIYCPPNDTERIQYEGVVAFKGKVKERFLYGQFDSAGDWGSVFKAHLCRWVPSNIHERRRRAFTKALILIAVAVVIAAIYGFRPSSKCLASLQSAENTLDETQTVDTCNNYLEAYKRLPLVQKLEIALKNPGLIHEAENDCFSIGETRAGAREFHEAFNGSGILKYLSNRRVP